MSVLVKVSLFCVKHWSCKHCFKHEWTLVFISFCIFLSPSFKSQITLASLPLAIIRSTKVLYMSSSFWLLGVESCDLSQAEKERTTYLQSWANPQNDNYFHSKFWVKIVVSLCICSAVLFLSAWEKSHDSTPNSQK